MRIIAAFCCFLLMLAQPALAANTPAMQSFEQQLRALIKSQSGDYGVAALDLETGELVSVRGDEPFPMAACPGSPRGSRLPDSATWRL